MINVCVCTASAHDEKFRIIDRSDQMLTSCCFGDGEPCLWNSNYLFPAMVRLQSEVGNIILEMPPGHAASSQVIGARITDAGNPFSPRNLQ